MKTFILTITLLVLSFLRWAPALAQQPSTAADGRCPAPPCICNGVSWAVSQITIPHPVPNAGGVYSFSMDVTPHGFCPLIWNLTSPSWISCSPVSGYIGHYDFIVTILPSDTVRTGSIVVVSGVTPHVTIIVNQGAPDPISCQDISLFQARCQPGDLVKAKVIMTDTSHTGDQVEINIDENAYTVTIASNGVGLLSQTGSNLGAHIVELAVPPGCFPPTTITCSAGLAKDGDDSWVYDLVEDRDESWEMPSATVLLKNYPDPFNPSTTIRYALSEDTHVTLKVYNMLGQLVATLVDELQFTGYQQAVWNGSNDYGQKVAGGIYIYRMTAGRFTETKRMLLIK